MEFGAFSETLKGYGDWIDGVYIKQFGTSTPKGDPLNTSGELECWLDQKFDETVSGSGSYSSATEGGVSPVRMQLEDEWGVCESKLEMAQGETSESADVAPCIQEVKQEPKLVSGSEERVCKGDLGGHHISDPFRGPTRGPVDDEDSQMESAADTTITWEDITICQLRSSSMLRVSVVLQGKQINAVVDTAAEVTIISDSVFREMEPKPPCLKNVILHTAGRDMKMEGFVVGPVALKLGNSTFPEAVYVAPIQDDMLLGLDFLLRHGVDIKLNELYLYFREEGEKVAIEVDKKVAKENIVAKVIIEKNVKVPPNSVLRLQCEITDRLTDYIIEPEEDLEVIVPRTLHLAGSNPKVCLLNITDKFIKLKRNQLVAKAFPVCSIMSIPVDDSGKLDSCANVQSSSNNTESDLLQVRRDNLNISGGRKSPEAQLSNEERGNRMLLSDMALGHSSQKQVNVAEVREWVPDGRDENLSEQRELPEHLKDLFQRSVEYLEAEEQVQLADLLIQYEDVFAKSEFDLGNFSDIVHTIDTCSAKPIKQRMRRTPVGFASEEEAHLKKMLKAGVIQPSVSEWASAPVLVRKRDGTVRWCVDYRALNSVTTKDVFPLPLVDDCLDTLAGNKWFSKLDANSAYWQVRISEADRKKTAFITKYGLFEHVRMGFGLCNGPATYSRVMNLILRGLLWIIVLAFLDDILVLGSTFQDHLRHIQEVLLRFRKYQLKLKPKKCVLFQKQVDFLGRIVSEEGISLSEIDIKAVLDWPVSRNTREVEQFLGLANYHRNFIKNFSRIAVPLYRLTGKNPFVWSEAQQYAFEDLKVALTSAPVLGLPNNSDPLILDTDASNYAIGGELIQIQNGEERVIAYASYALTPEQINYCTTRKELLAVVRFTRQFRHYLLGRQFLIRTDHSSLRWLLNFKEPDGQLARWLEELSQYDMVVKHRAGKKHGDADSLSRIQHEDQNEACSNYRFGVTPEDLPCAGCKKCRRAHENWSRFTEEIDDVVPLTCCQIAIESTFCEVPLASAGNQEAQNEIREFIENLSSVDNVWPWDPGKSNSEEIVSGDEADCHIDLSRESTGEMQVCQVLHRQNGTQELEDSDTTALPASGATAFQITSADTLQDENLLKRLKTEQCDDSD